MERPRASLSVIGLPLVLAVVFAVGCAKPDSGSSVSTCPDGQTSCNGACVDLNSNAQHCGSCDTSCAANQSCGNGSCSCASGYDLCGGTTCVSLSSTQHCGSCTNQCSVQQVCNANQCSSSCSGGTTNCSGSCVNTMADVANCGQCGNRCPVGQTCNSGSCGCPSGQVLCNGSCAATCTSSGQGGSSGSGGKGGSGTGAGGASGAGGVGSGQGGMTGGTPPPGWFTSGSWQGCSWTAKDTVTNSTTTNSPMDFLTTTAFPYCVSGTVNPTYESVAILGFNLNESITGSNTQCAYKPADPTAVGPPGVALTGNGIAIAFARTKGSNLRIQIQGPNGGMNNTTGQNDRWCYTITEVEGPVFAPFSKFNTACWDMSGNPYNGEPISAVSFLVPGLPTPSPFSYCIGGFATGSSATNAPAYTPNPPNPVVTGTIGGQSSDTTVQNDLSFQRVKVSPAGSTAQYIVQNNNWGTPMTTSQTISYTGNSFTVMNSTGSVTGSGVPASFPSIYVGANGDTQNANDPPKGVFSTRPVDGLPKVISNLGSANTTFTWTGGSGNKDFNATYDIWVAAPGPNGSLPTTYADAISGFVMVWLYKPSSRTPIGTKQPNQATIGGTTYDVYVGPRGSSPNGGDANRPVVSYVIANSTTTPVMSKTFDLKPILMDAASHGIPSTWMVTDIFGGFEIWTGSTASGLSMSNFTVAVQ
jgi:hypothetical protein